MAEIFKTFDMAMAKKEVKFDSEGKTLFCIAKHNTLKILQRKYIISGGSRSTASEGHFRDSAKWLTAVDDCCKELHLFILQKQPLKGISWRVLLLNFKSTLRDYFKL